MKKIITFIILVFALATPNFANTYKTTVQYKTSNIVSQNNSGQYVVLINNTAQIFIGRVIEMENTDNGITNVTFLFEINGLKTPINEITCNSYTLNTGNGFIKSESLKSNIEEYIYEINR